MSYDVFILFPRVPIILMTSLVGHRLLGQLVSWCFEPSQPRGIISGLIGTDLQHSRSCILNFQTSIVSPSLSVCLSVCLSLSHPNVYSLRTGREIVFFALSLWVSFKGFVSIERHIAVLSKQQNKFFSTETKYRQQSGGICGRRAEYLADLPGCALHEPNDSTVRLEH